LRFWASQAKEFKTPQKKTEEYFWGEIPKNLFFGWKVIENIKTGTFANEKPVGLFFSLIYFYCVFGRFLAC
jgi:hypothetical protein